MPICRHSPRKGPAIRLGLMPAVLMTLLLASCPASEDGGGSGGGGGGGGYPDPGPRNPLSADITSLDYYWGIEAIATGLGTPCKMAQAPDGRLFVSELNGTLRIIETTPPYTQHVFASESVLTGNERGLLGVALSPDFTTNGYVYVMLCINDITDRQQVIRYTAVGNTSTARTVLIDNLPIAQTHNAGAIKFGLDGRLYVSVGDAEVDTNSQTNGSLAGRILRYNEDGSIPATNPKFGTVDAAEWCRGLRNAFGMCVHPTTGTILITENGPNNNDELNYVSPGKNFEWGSTGGIPGAEIGTKLRNWGSVIVPTGLTYHSGNNAPPNTADALFICSYDEEVVYKFKMDGNPPVNIDTEEVFLEFTKNFQANKPLDIIEANDGSLYVSTFTAIWRVYRRTGP